MLARQQPSPISPPPTAPAGLARWSPSLYGVALIAVLAAVFIFGLAPRLDTDLWWHLRVGAFIAAHHAVPSRDMLSYTFVGHAWTDYEWLAELCLYLLYTVGGLWGPLVFFALVMCATFYLAYLQAVQRGVHRILALFVLTTGLLASSATLGARIQMLTLLFLAIYGLVVHRFITRRDGRVLAILPICMLLWTNLHGGFVLGILLVALSLVGEWINNVTGREDALKGDELRGLLLALVGTVSVTVVNPNGFRQLLFPFTLSLPNAYTNHLNEWVSIDFHMPQMMVFEGMLLLLLASAFLGRSRVNWTHLLMFVAFTHLALSQMRNVAVWVVVVSPLFAYYLQNAGTTLMRTLRPHPRRRRQVSAGRAAILNLVMLLLCLLLYAVEAAHFINPRALQDDEARNFPAGSVAYLQSHSLPSHLLASYAWGGYVVWKLYPRYRDFIDGRANSVFDDHILFEYLDAYSAAPDWKRVLRSHDVQTVILEPSAPLAQALAQDPSWHLRYHDAVSVLYVRG